MPIYLDVCLNEFSQAEMINWFGMPCMGLDDVGRCGHTYMSQMWPHPLTLTSHLVIAPPTDSPSEFEKISTLEETFYSHLRG